MINNYQISTVDFIYQEFDGILAHHQNEFDPLLFEVLIDKDYDALAFKLDYVNRIEKNNLYIKKPLEVYSIQTLF